MSGDDGSEMEMKDSKTFLPEFLSRRTEEVDEEKGLLRETVLIWCGSSRFSSVLAGSRSPQVLCLSLQIRDMSLDLSF